MADDRPKAIPGIPGGALPPPRPRARPTTPPLPIARPTPRQPTLPGPDLDETQESPGARDVDRRQAPGTVSAPLVVEPESLPRGHVLATDRNWPPNERPPGQRSVSPIPWDARASSPELAREVARHGDRLVRAPESAPASSVATPLVVTRHRPPPWWEQGEMVLKVIGAVVTGLLALGGAGLIARGNPEPPPPVEMKCPPFEERKAPRSAFCERLDQLEELLGELQSKERARREREEREKKMLAQEPPTLKP